MAEEVDAPDPNDSDSQWEYEYDDIETEDIYVTLDLTTHAPQAHRKRKRSPQRSPSPSESHQQAEDEETQANTANESTVHEAQQAEGPEPSVPVSKRQIQLLDLHSDNPLIQHDGQIYSCNWASSIGTDLLFEYKPSQVASGDADAGNDQIELAPEVLYETSEFRLHAATPHRLVARPVELAPLPVATPLGGQNPNDTDANRHEEGKLARESFRAKLAELKAAKRGAQAAATGTTTLQAGQNGDIAQEMDVTLAVAQENAVTEHIADTAGTSANHTEKD